MRKVIIAIGIVAFSLQFAWMAWTDYKKKEVPLGEILKAGIIALFYSFFQLFLTSKDERFWFLLDEAEGIMIGMVFLGISLVSSQKIGTGDSLLVLILGLFSGGWRLIGILEISCVLLFGRALWIWKKGGNVNGDRIPFYPFLFLGFLLTTLLGSW